MPNINMEAIFSAVSVPAWVAVLGAFAVILLLLIVMRPHSERDPLSLFAQFALVAVVGAAAFFGLTHMEEATRLADRRGLEERIAVLSVQTVQPGSNIACVDGAADKALTDACERNLFVAPERVAAGLALARARLALVADGFDYAAREPAFVERTAGIRRALEADPYGFVAFVLASEDKCTADTCSRFRVLRDSARIKGNLRERRFETLVAKYGDAWHEPKPVAATPPPAPVAVTPPPAETPPPAPVVTPPPPATAAQPPAPPRAHPKQKAKDTGAVRPRTPPEPVAGLPRVVPRRPAADDDDDTPPPQSSSGVRPPAQVAPRQN